MKSLLKSFCILTLLTGIVFGQLDSQTFLSLKQTGVEEFIQAHPDHDGRGTIVFIFDTGVDMGVEGLLKTTTGDVKVIDVQDFTGQGDVKFFEADTDEEDGINYFVNEDENMKVAGAGKLDLNPIDEEYYIGVLPEKLWLNSGSGASDVNNNGTKDDLFYFVTFKTGTAGSEYWVVYFDSNGDGDLSDEKPLRDYKVNYDAFNIETAEGLAPFTMGLNIFPDEQKVNFFFDDGAHGTHCAGISTGYQIGGVDFNGVAPGANVIGCKLGNNNFAGGATVTESMKKCFLYADKISKETGKPCVINMSFGIGSEIEGRAEMEKFIEELTTENPYLYVCTSNGNEGPGLSTSGLPAASWAVFSSGAVLTTQVGSDMYGATLPDDIILHFSSRGGEVSKPDVVSPGAAASTIPNFSRGDRMWGTSMASPYSAGIMSLLLSAAVQEYPDIKVPSQFLYKVVRESAVKIEGYEAIDQGGGYVNIVNAYELLKKYIDAGELNNYETYKISSLAPNMPDNSAPNLYIRDGSFLTGNETFTFQVTRNNTINKDQFYRVYNLESSKDWLVPVQKKMHIRNNQSGNVEVKLDMDKMKEPGMYNAVITAYRADKSNFPEFSMMVTIVIPNNFTELNDYKMNWKDEKLNIGEHKRYYVKVPAGGTSMRTRVTSDEDTYTNVWYFLHDPAGEQIGFDFINFEEEEFKSDRYYYNLEPGIYELVVLGYFRSRNISSYDLSVEFESIDVLNKNPLSENHNQLELVNQFNKDNNYNMSGKILGYETFHSALINAGEEYEIPFVLRKGEASKTFEIMISKEDFNKVTDFALMIYDENGEAKGIGGISYNEGSVSVRNRFDADSVNLKFVMIPAFTHSEGEVFVHITEKAAFKSETNFSVEEGKNSRLTLYPSISEIVNCEIKKPAEFVPENAEVFGEIHFDSSNNESVYVLPVKFNYNGE
ncbi:MAG: S8 family serine peptidase [Melioribacteraceae bacterium]|nr:S8 family serine peptidase [Melioribacteraceae bacterium]MCF8354207.1 S8 family serine peptidase [Melioribacteraceae bacterium]MCF8392853.1 S8 family serine peptidase [Melioribacteraceae bacterium]MCF8418661.1 S8 family serine peptidase [Melioribacteraceae bacterium]